MFLLFFCVFCCVFLFLVCLFMNHSPVIAEATSANPIVYRSSKRMLLILVAFAAVSIPLQKFKGLGIMTLVTAAVEDCSYL